MVSNVSAPVIVSQATKQTLTEMSNPEEPTMSEPKVLSEAKDASNATSQIPVTKLVVTNSNTSIDSHVEEYTMSISVNSKGSCANKEDKQSQKSNVDATEVISDTVVHGTIHQTETQTSCNGAAVNKSSTLCDTSNKEEKKAIIKSSAAQTNHALEASVKCGSKLDTPTNTDTQDISDKPNQETVTSHSKSLAKKPTNSKSSNKKPIIEDGEEPEKKAKVGPSSSKGGGKSSEQILEYMEKTFEQRRKIITKQMPSIPELKKLYPELFTGKQLLLEFQRITKIDIDQKIQEFCVRYATAVIEMAENKKEAAPVLARWEQAKLENDTLKQYWDMVTALCLLPLHFGENFVEMVLEIGDDEEVVAQGKIVPTLIARGNIFRTDEFFLIAENTIVQEFEEFTIAFASLYSSYWVFNMVYPETIENTYNYIQRCIVRQREPGSIPLECKNFTKALLKWNKEKDGK